PDAGKNGFNNVTLSEESLPGNNKYLGTMKAGGSMTLKPITDINGVSGTSTVKADKDKYRIYKKYTDTSVSYRSSDVSVLTVDNKGKIKANKDAAGKSAVVYAASADGTYAAQITITIR
ncbi:MAG: hypothetical protein IKS84_04290, partial [Lachnospiraceae bacterium]|nr:hypothetical protein [Lachnospiraceae bacterium]